MSAIIIVLRRRSLVAAKINVVVDYEFGRIIITIVLSRRRPVIFIKNVVSYYPGRGVRRVVLVICNPYRLPPVVRERVVNYFEVLGVVNIYTDAHVGVGSETRCRVEDVVSHYE